MPAPEPVVVTAGFTPAEGDAIAAAPAEVTRLRPITAGTAKQGAV